MEDTRLVEWIVGDWSGDGHEKSNSFTILTNLSREDILRLNKRLAEKWGFALASWWAPDTDPLSKYNIGEDNTRIIFCGYMEDSLPVSVYKTLMLNGFSFSFSYTDEENRNALKAAHRVAAASGDNDFSNKFTGVMIAPSEFMEIVIFCLRAMAIDEGLHEVKIELSNLEVSPLAGGYGLFS